MKVDLVSACEGLHFKDDEGWRAFFSRFSDIVLVGNSYLADPATLASMFPPSTLFVFFNKVYKVLDSSFDRTSLLVARSGSMGANIVYRREVSDVLRYFPKDRFEGVLNIKAAPSERFSPIADFAAANAFHVDLAPRLEGRYPADKIATSGFALIMWLQDLGIRSNIVLAGFSGKRSEKWKVFDVHDWTFEQIYLRLCARHNKIAIVDNSATARALMLSKCLPEVPRDHIFQEMFEVLSERLDGANSQIDRLMSITKLHRSLDTWFRRFRPKTRKERQRQ